MSSNAPPASICLLRTSALGDVTHVIPLLRTIQRAWPQTSLTWLIGKLERKLVGDIEGIEFVTFDKAAGMAGYKDVRAALRGRRFDALLQMQVALRSNLLSLCVKADRRIGYDHARSKDLHGLFVNERIAARSGEHVLDAIGSFVKPLGLKQTDVSWDIPVPTEAREWAAQQWGESDRVLIISPCSSHALRNWRAERYAAIADHAAQALGMRLALCGGPSAAERAMGDAIKSRMKTAPIDLIGRDTLKRALALYPRAFAVLTPDAGPMHMANAAGAKVIGLHAASNPARSGPYSDQRWCVDRYDTAARKYLHKPATDIPWGSKIEYPGVMDLIEVGDVIERLEALMRSV